MKRILVIDDDKEVLASLGITFGEHFSDVEFKYEPDLDKGFIQVSSFRPHAVVLYLREGPTKSNLPGQRTWQDIWNSRFCPIAIYTGGDGDLVPRIPSNHPFVKLVQKGRDSEDRLVAAIEGFMPGIAAIQQLRSELESVIQQVLRETAPTFPEPVNKDDLLHAGRRRVAASMDAPTLTSDRMLTSWEQYLLPAIGDSPLTADLLREQRLQINDPKAYRLILTPSCDLVRGRNERTLVVAHCEGTSRLAKKLNLSPGVGKNKRKENIAKVKSRALTTGVCEGLLPMPRLPGRLPLMVANLKNLAVIRYDSIGGLDSAQRNFERVASIDSPFREQVAWAFLTTVARPGMPERDLDLWAEEIVEDAAKAAGTTPSETPE